GLGATRGPALARQRARRAANRGSDGDAQRDRGQIVPVALDAAGAQQSRRDPWSCFHSAAKPETFRVVIDSLPPRSLAPSSPDTDAYDDLLTRTRGLQREQRAQRDFWFSTLPLEAKDDILFELEIVLKSAACF